MADNEIAADSGDSVDDSTQPVAADIAETAPTPGSRVLYLEDDDVAHLGAGQLHIHPVRRTDS
ncbi:hypothetical protein [Nocardia sp. NPDC006630]|uniref:hypothetical protein n=1 Tax=Nocardia sp. NPDC006630 TaxID=3157181 RepID=UPI0033BD2FE1